MFCQNNFASVLAVVLQQAFRVDLACRHGLPRLSSRTLVIIDLCVHVVRFWHARVLVVFWVMICGWSFESHVIVGAKQRMLRLLV